LNPERKVRTIAPANQQHGRYALQVEHINDLWAWLWLGQWVEQWVWPGGMWLDITPYTHIILLSRDNYYVHPLLVLIWSL